MAVTYAWSTVVLAVAASLFVWLAVGTDDGQRRGFYAGVAAFWWFIVLGLAIGDVLARLGIEP